MKFRDIIIIALSVLLVSGAVLYSCTRKKVDYLGPEYLSAPAGFSANSLTVTNPVDFSTGKCTLNVSFSNRVTYTVTYKGLSSGATRSYTGLNNFVDATTVGGIWDGTHDGINFFRSGETVSVTVSFLQSSYTISGTTFITTAKDYLTGANIVSAAVSNDGFENPGLAGFPTQFAFLSVPTCTNGKTIVNSTLGAPEGLNCFQLEGQSCQSDGYFIGGIQCRTNTGFHMPSTWTDPSQIYFNVYIYGQGSKNGRVSLEFHEADLSNDATKPRGECWPPNVVPTGTNPPTIGVGQHDKCTDDAWVIQVPIDHVGWKLVSVKYSDMTPNASLTDGGSGNKIKEPTRVHRIQMGLLSIPTPAKYLQVYFDYPVITYGAPFDPTK